jgi:hypothetical protein
MWLVLCQIKSLKRCPEKNYPDIFFYKALVCSCMNFYQSVSLNKSGLNFITKLENIIALFVKCVPCEAFNSIHYFCLQYSQKSVFY